MTINENAHFKTEKEMLDVIYIHIIQVYDKVKTNHLKIDKTFKKMLPK